MPSSILSLATLALVASPAVATNYNLLHKFDQSNFFQNFSFYSDPDPTNGFVQYLDYDAAHEAGLAKIKSGNVYLGVDSTNTYTTGGRPSTRVMSDIQFDQGLLIADIAHMPGNACGVWPALWTTGSNWPADGEIDIIEGINKQATTQVALHTLNSCDISTTASELAGELTATACSTSVGSGGCTVQGTEGSFGDAFNELGGGVYAMELTSQAIKVWFFSRANVPECITSGNPDTSSFGTPMAVFQGSCDFESDFKNQQIIFNTDFCGDWAGYSYGSSCPLSSGLSAMSSCNAYVGANPSAFTEAYWEIVSVGLYQKGSASVSSVSLTTAATSTAAVTSTAATSTIPASTAPATVPTSTGSGSLTSSPVRSSPSGRYSSHPIAPSSGSGLVGSSAHVSPAKTPCSSKSSVTVTSTVTPSNSAYVAPTTSPCSSKSTVTVTSFTSPPPSVQTVSPASSKLTTTTVIVTTYVDVCPTGYTTKTITQTVTYCPADVTSSSITPVFTTTSKLCTSGCAPSPTTVVVVIPVETSTTPAKVTGTSLGSGSIPALGSETGTLPALAVSAPVTSKTGINTSVSPVRTGIYSTGGLVPVAPSSITGPAGAKPSSSLPGGGSVTSSGVSPAFTGAGSRITPSAVGFIAAVAGFVLFI